MMDRIRNLKEQVIEEQEDKRKYELQALQAQINPHFLYNTLDSIIWMAETNDSNIVAMTEALAKLFRISLNKGNEEISLERELEHVKNYLIIQSMRYADKFTYEISVDPGVERCRQSQPPRFSWVKLSMATESGFAHPSFISLRIVPPPGLHQSCVWE